MQKATVSAQDYIYLSTFQHIDEVFLNKPERENFFEIYWIKNKSPLYFSETNKSKIKGDWLYLVPPYRDYQFDRTGKHGVLIAFDKELLAYEAKEFSLSVFNLFTKEGDSTVLFIEEKSTKALTSMLNLLSEEYAENNGNVLLLKTLLKAFLLKLMDDSRQILIIPDINEKRIYDFLSLLESHYKEEKSVDFYASRLSLSPKRLNQILKEKLDKTITQLLQERLLIEARHLLFNGAGNIKEISFALGFQDSSYFSRFFKKMTGLTPESFKKKIKKGFQ